MKAPSRSRLMTMVLAAISAIVVVLAARLFPDLRNDDSR
jgi:hypothetical protein